jgi:integrase
MSVYKRYQGKRIDSKHPKYKDARWWVYRRVRGQKTIHKSLPDCLTKADAEEAERREIDKARRRRYGLPDETITFAAFADGTYMKYVRQHNVNIAAKEIYLRELKEFFKKKLLIDVTPQDCRDCQYWLGQKKTSEDEKRKPSYVNRFMSTLRKMFQLACEEGVLERNPMEFVKDLKEPEKRRKMLTEAQRARLWEELEKDALMKSLFTLAVNLPLRRGQILAITKEAVDFENRVLLAVGSKGRPPRLVPLNDTAWTTLKRLADRVESGHLFRVPDDNVVPEKRGMPLKDFKRRWSSLLVRCGINEKDGKREENFHFHDLRKELAGNLIKNNVNPKTVQHLFNHSSQAITDIYISEDFDQMFAAVKSLDAQEIGGEN